jgi:hypothetical protein
MRIMVTGSRRWVDEAAIRMALFPWMFLSEDITLIHGDAKGADRQAEKAAKLLRDLINNPPYNGMMDLEIERFRPVYRPADPAWNKVAPLRRNDEMLATEPDVVLAFKLGYGGHGGTQYTINRAQGLGIPVWIVNHPELEEDSVQADEGAAT